MFASEAAGKILVCFQAVSGRPQYLHFEFDSWRCTLCLMSRGLWMQVMKSRLRIRKIYIVVGSILHKANTRRQIDPTPNLSYLKPSVYMLSIFIP